MSFIAAQLTPEEANVKIGDIWWYIRSPHDPQKRVSGRTEIIDVTLKYGTWHVYYKYPDNTGGAFGRTLREFIEVFHRTDPCSTDYIL